jgi:hypothetical protein
MILFWALSNTQFTNFAPGVIIEYHQISSDSITYLLTHFLTYLLTHLLTYLLTYSLTYLLTYSLYLLTHLLHGAESFLGI